MSNALLLDTQVLIWSRLYPRRLSTTCRDLLDEASNRFVVSVASLWEMAIKTSKGKLALPESIWQLPNVEILPIEAEHALAVRNLLSVKGHSDPFDRMLIVQAQMERLDILSADPRFDLYDVKRRW